MSGKSCLSSRSVLAGAIGLLIVLQLWQLQLVRSSLWSASEPALPRWLATSADLSSDLRHAALIDRIDTHPGEVESLVNESATLRSGEMPARSDIAAGLVTLQALDRSLASVRTIRQAETVLRARGAVTERLQSQVAALANQLSKRAETLAGDPTSALADVNWASEVDGLISLDQQMDRPTGLASAIALPIVQAAVRVADEQLGASRMTIGRLESAAIGQSQVEPAAPATASTQPAQGDCQRSIGDLARIMELVSDDRLHRWADTSELEQSLADGEQRSSEQIAALNRLQLSLYNFWAIRQIYAAEDSGEWPTYLGSVDRNLIHPSVAAMWNLVHDRRFAEVQDREQRPAVVRRLLTTPPVGLERF